MTTTGGSHTRSHSARWFEASKSSGNKEWCHRHKCGGGGGQPSVYWIALISLFVMLSICVMLALYNSPGVKRSVYNYHNAAQYRQLLKAEQNQDYLSNYLSFLDEFETLKELGMMPNKHIFENMDIYLKDDEAKDLWLEFGVFAGSSINYISQFTTFENKIYGFDGFEGLPEKWRTGFNASMFTLQGVLPKVSPNVNLVKGWFDESLPRFIEEHIKGKGRGNTDVSVSFLHIDCDLYSSSKTVLDLLAPYIKEDCIVVFDELWNYPGFRKHEAKAFYEFIQEYDVKYEWIGTHGEPVAVYIRSTKYTQ